MGFQGHAGIAALDGNKPIPARLSKPNAVAMEPGFVSLGHRHRWRNETVNHFLGEDSPREQRCPKQAQVARRGECSAVWAADRWNRIDVCAPLTLSIREVAKGGILRDMSNPTATAVKILLPDAMANRVSTLLGIRFAQSAKPNVRSNEAPAPSGERETTPEKSVSLALQAISSADMSAIFISHGP